MNKEEYEKWVYSCKFVESSMQFYSYKDFIYYAKYLKELYSNMDGYGKEMYKFYVFSKPIKPKLKFKIWDYLNSNIAYEELLIIKDNS